MLKATVCFHLYQNLFFARIKPCCVSILFSIIDRALESCKQLVSQRKAWWGIVDVPFRAVCVLLSINTIESHEYLGKSLRVLREIADTFQSHMTQEALHTACGLCEGMRNKKLKEINLEIEYLSDVKVSKDNEFEDHNYINSSSNDISLICLIG